LDFGRNLLNNERNYQVYGNLLRTRFRWEEFRTYSHNYQEIYMDAAKKQTFMGYVGYIDLFPAQNSVFNTKSFFKKLFNLDQFNLDIYYQMGDF